MDGMDGWMDGWMGSDGMGSDGWMDGRTDACMMDEWMDCSFTSFTTAFQSYQGNERVILKDCMQGKPVNSLKYYHHERGLSLGLLDQQASA